MSKSTSMDNSHQKSYFARKKALLSYPSLMSKLWRITSGILEKMGYIHDVDYLFPNASLGSVAVPSKIK